VFSLIKLLLDFIPPLFLLGNVGVYYMFMLFNDGAHALFIFACQISMFYSVVM
jgi:hypothetical protein